MVFDRALPIDPVWPGTRGRPTVLLVDASSELEEKLIVGWAARRGDNYETIRIPPSRRRRPGIRPDSRLEARLGRDDNPLIVPVRVVWQAVDRNGTRSVRLTDLLKFGDPRDPNVLRQHLFLRRFPDRCQIVLGEPAGAATLREAWKASDDVVALREFVARRAWLTLERAERRVRGNRYKVPKFLTEEIVRTGSFRDGISRLSTETGKAYAAVHKEALKNLREIAASHSPLVIDLAANLINRLYRQGYGSINYDPAHLNRLYQLGEQHPLIFLPSHKSQLDRLMLQYILWENDRPPNHTAGGINMNFFPIGQIIRRSGVFFIRRTFKDKPIYKFALRSYIDFLIEKRFPIEWYLEGGRSRSGKLLPPKFGMLSYVTDSYLRDKAEDIILLPVSIAYDQIQDVADYAREQRGEAKKGESISWVVHAISQLRRRHGNVYVRFGEPVSLAKALPAGTTDSDEKSIAIQKVAFEVMVQIGRVTPISPTAGVCIALLSRPNTARSAHEIRDSLAELAEFVIRRRLPITERVLLDGTDQVVEVLERLVEHDIVTRVDGGRTAVYQIGADQHLSAAYYRNVVIHFFVNSAIAELALQRVATEQPSDPLTVFWDEAMVIRDLLKFEFFFAAKEEYQAEIGAELGYFDPDWAAVVSRGDAAQVLQAIRPTMSTWVLAPFLESYAVVAEVLNSLPATVDDKTFMTRAIGLGKSYQSQGKITAAESVSQVFFKTALDLARNRGLAGEQAEEADAAALASRRKEFVDEVDDLLNRIRAIAVLKDGEG
ncbi:MAG: glycerol-3-phosphate 1-O-acyltransferase [Acidimicrobiia bacterium]|nr:glycerol-3-phosphate 1-O-acyltransferase [Acidimicrobiia bacterium]